VVARLKETFVPHPSSKDRSFNKSFVSAGKLLANSASAKLTARKLDHFNRFRSAATARLRALFNVNNASTLNASNTQQVDETA